jgi:hypothetical protein
MFLVVICFREGVWEWGVEGNERDGVTKEWRKLHNEELNDLY